MSPKILLALQYWPGDKDQAMRLAQFIADLQPAHTDMADFLFVPRFDCKTDEAVVKTISRKFNTFTYLSKRRGTGWPHGCNELFFGMLEWFYNMKKDGKIPHYKAVFAMESDCVPLNREWIKHLSLEWDELNQKHPTYISGAWLPNCPRNDGTGHINGNALVSGDLKFLKWFSGRIGRANSGAGWDWLYANDLKKWGWAVMPGMVCKWRTELTEELLASELHSGTIWFHGCKNANATDLVRKYLL